MAPFDRPSAVVRAAAIAALMAYRGWKRKSLTAEGAAAAWTVGFLSLAAGGRGALLLLFYAAGTKATKYRGELKSKLDQSAAESSCRGPGQVLACSALGVAIQMAHVYWYGGERPVDFIEHPEASSLACALVAHHATSLADTLASELGILSKSCPVLITTGKSVPPGTNGGVTWMGTGCSALGGLIIGMGAAILDAMSGLRVQLLAYILFGAACGIVGSIVDSLLGATLQVTYFDPDKKVVSSTRGAPTLVPISGRDLLTNAQVNVASIVITSALGAVAGPLFFR